jgi:hypothetical protein
MSPSDVTARVLSGHERRRPSRSLGFAVLALLSAGFASASLRYVAPTGADTGSCTSPGSPCRTLQYAVDLAAVNDEIRIAAGEYTGCLDHAAPAGYTPATVKQVVFIDKTVALRGGFTTASWITPNPATNVTTINAQGGCRCVFASGTLDPALTNTSPVLEGLRIVGGNASGLRGYLATDAGGGVYVFLAQATVRNCSFNGNTGSTSTKGSGGGLAAYYAPLTLANTTFESNVASTVDRGNGGGAFVFPGPAGAVLTGNTFRTNTGGSAAGGGGGGAAYLTQMAATLSGNTVDGNVAASASNAAGYGGGLYSDNCALTLQDNVIRNNRAGAAGPSGSGGGIYLVDGSLASSGDQITGNTGNARSSGGAGRGGGLYTTSQRVGQTARVALKNTSVTGNRGSAASASDIGSQGGGIYLSTSDATLSGCTVENNVGSVGAMAYGGGLYLLDAEVRFTGGVIRGNSAGATLGGGGGIYVSAPITRPNVGLTLADTLVEGNTAGGSQRGDGGGVMVERYSPVLLVGNRIVGNAANGPGGGVSLGSELYDANPTFTTTVPAVVLDNLIRGNRSKSVSYADGGGGVFASWGSAGWGGLVIALNRVEGNTAGNDGGGSAGGIQLQRSAYSRIDSNLIVTNTGAGRGGGIALESSDHVVIEGNTVQGNTGCSACTFPGAGGMFLSGGWIEVSRNLVVGNSASGAANENSTGGGIGGNTGRSWSITNNIVADNTAAFGSGLSFYGNLKPYPFRYDLITSGLIAHNTIANNHGGREGVSLSSTQGPVTTVTSGAAKGATLVPTYTGAGWNVGDIVSLISGSTDWITTGWEAHTIAAIQNNTGLVLDAPLQHNYGAGSLVAGTRLVLVNNVIAAYPCGIHAHESDTLVTGVNWFGNTADVCNTYVDPHLGTFHYLVGVSNATTGDPAFADAANGDYHLTGGSAAIDKGVASAVAVDFDNQPRPAGALPDLGADEYASGCKPVTAVTIGGAATAAIGVPASLTASTSPAGATANVELMWIPEPATGQGTASATYTFATTGSPVVTALARNCGGAVSASRAIGVGACGLDCTASVPATVQPGRDARFAATATAIGCTEPVEYRWSFGDEAASIQGPTAVQAYGAVGRYGWTLTVTTDAAVCVKTGEIRVEAKKGHLRRVLPPAW